MEKGRSKKKKNLLFQTCPVEVRLYHSLLIPILLCNLLKSLQQENFTFTPYIQHRTRKTNLESHKKTGFDRNK